MDHRRTPGGSSVDLAHVTTRVAIYARVSTTRQETENQVAQLREFSVTRGWMIVAEYLDQATGSSTNGRPEFKRLFQDAAQRRFDLVLFWALDRFTREGTLLTLQYLEQLTSYGVGWRSFTEQYLDSTGLFRDAVISILATIAKQKRVRISERVKAGLAHARRTGKHLGRPRVGVDAFRIASLRAQGRSWAQITAETGVSKGTAQRAVLALPKID